MAPPSTGGGVPDRERADTVQTYVETFDTTLRDGTQSEGASLTLKDKLRVIGKLDSLGVDFIEAGYPASNSKDAELFAAAAGMNLSNARLVAFSATCHKGVAACDDPALQALLQARTDYVSVVGKASRAHITEVLETTPDENLRMIRDTVELLVSNGKSVMFDAEHFFDGYREDSEVALGTIMVAARAGASHVVLCDTNGGTLPHEVGTVVGNVVESLASEGLDCKVAIHAHDDCGCAVANSLEAVRAGARMVQGTVNGYGERVGNADLITLIADLEFKMGVETVGRDRCRQLTSTANYVADVFNRSLEPNKPFVGSSAFAHKGGLHVSGLSKLPHAYEHVDPLCVGNLSHVVVSELSGRASVISKSEEFGLDIADSGADIQALLARIKDMESSGYSFELADASLELMFRSSMGLDTEIFRLESYRVITDRRENGKALSEATIKIHVGEERFVATGEGNGPVNALDNALRKAITRFYPQVANINLSDFKVRVLDESSGTDAVTRVIIESTDGQSSWVTIGVDENVIEASWSALVDSIAYGLLVASHGHEDLL